MTREDALNKTIGILTYHQVNFCKSKEAVANMNEIIDALEKIDQECVDDKDTNVTATDCISREAALDDAGLGEFHRYDDYVKMRNYLKSLPSVTPQPKMGQWIPCSERLPEVGQRVIATVESIDGNYVRETIYDKHGFLCGKGIAWMYIPEPYLPDINVGNMSEIPTGEEVGK